MLTYAEMKKKMLENPATRAEYQRLEREEMPVLDAILSARKDSSISAKTSSLLFPRKPLRRRTREGGYPL
mgnify:CR=1 FL=1